MSNYHLRPVSEHSRSRSPSPTISATPSDERIPSFSKGLGQTIRPSPPASTPLMSSGLLRRPLSPSSIRDVDLSHDTDLPPRKYPAPPTGHDLMALFPPAPPDTFPEMRPGPTSGYFQRQERAFFAQAGKEIVRVRMAVDVPTDPEAENVPGGKARSSRPWSSSGPTPQLPPHPQHQSPAQTSDNASVLYPHPNPRISRTAPGAQTPQFPMTAHSHSQHSPSPNLHPPSIQPHQQLPGIGLSILPHDPTQPGAPVNNTKMEFQSEEYRDNPDEAWRRAIPHAERRRAGKHTRRVIVRN